MARLYHRVLVLVGVSVSIGAAVAAACGKSRLPQSPEPSGGSGAQAGGALAQAGGGGTVARAGGSGSGGSGGSGGLPVVGSSGSPDPGESAQWNCEGAFTECQLTMRGTWATSAAGLLLTGECTVEPDRPRRQEDCGSGERLSCDLAVLPSGTQLLVDCECQSVGDVPCGNCTSRTSGTRVPAQCYTGIRVCPCRYEGK
jgi:hypothetical protein